MVAVAVAVKVVVAVTARVGAGVMGVGVGVEVGVSGVLAVPRGHGLLLPFNLDRVVPGGARAVPALAHSRHHGVREDSEYSARTVDIPRLPSEIKPSIHHVYMRSVLRTAFPCFVEVLAGSACVVVVSCRT